MFECLLYVSHSNHFNFYSFISLFPFAHSFSLFFMTIFFSNDFVFFMGSFRYHFSSHFPQNETQFYIRIMIDEVLTNTKKHSDMFNILFQLCKMPLKLVYSKGYLCFHIIWIVPGHFESLFLRCCIGHLTYFIQYLIHE